MRDAQMNDRMNERDSDRVRRSVRKLLQRYYYCYIVIWLVCYRIGNKKKTYTCSQLCDTTIYYIYSLIQGGYTNNGNYWACECVRASIFTVVR